MYIGIAGMFEFIAKYSSYTQNRVLNFPLSILFFISASVTVCNA
jgi:hypothetical protein